MSTIEEHLNSFDLYINMKDGKNVFKVGLTLHYSPTKEMWKAFYGLKSRTKWTGLGSTPGEALDNLNKILEQD